MKKNSYAFALLLAVVAAGCGPTESKVTKQEEQDFKGKPIPPEVLEKMRNQRPPSAGGPSGAPAPGQGQ